MANFYSIVSTYKDTERDSFYTQTQLPKQQLSIGWGDVNPINKTKNEIKKLIEEFYPDFEGTVNPHNGSESLNRFANLKPGDIVFVRGQAKVIDVIIITGSPFFDTIGHYDEDYYLKVPFQPLFNGIMTTLNTRQIPSDIYDDILYSGGRSMPVRELSEDTARLLLEEILKLMPRPQIIPLSESMN